MKWLICLLLMFSSCSSAQRDEIKRMLKGGGGSESQEVDCRDDDRQCHKKMDAYEDAFAE